MNFQNDDKHQSKRRNVLLLSFVTALSMMTGSGVVSAADSMDGTATLTVVAPTADALSLTGAPNIDFGTATIGAVSGVLPGATDKPYTIIDLRGGSTGYQVQVAASKFTLKSDNTKQLPVTAMTMQVADSTNGELTGTGSHVNIYQQPAVVLTGGVDSNGTQVSGDVSAGLTLDGTKIGSLKVGQYQATVTHSVVSGIQ
jgi:hypothetical protein